MANYRIKAKVETIRKFYVVDQVVEINLEGLSEFGLKSVAYGVLYQNAQEQSKNDIFVKIKDLTVEKVNVL